ncbi:DNA-binding LacI/PurR family transcriptional regulator [Kineococcus xinjiangensis]|uniref:DNA-binding LacI/PurR family transcriptional regulator n=1 Tax=Kineococcus xinjiangensis TaxID=512762 RepID=A0A2S6IE03_9ACTN|nr:LacI family DNA-binding transcriptional regulator [Kineococcus xinjiangensis]PPK92429.1 DNA-binding LacI/PurR family transcriptional regulator [Kineococcus xinjiangensis]
MTRRRTSLADIAARAGVSQATVSRALNGRPGVAQATRERIAAAVEGLGYQRLTVPQAHPAGLVGVVVPEIDNPVFPALGQAVGRVLVASGLSWALFSQGPGGLDEDQCTTTLLGHGACGAVMVSGLHADLSADASRYALLRERGLALVTVNGYRPTAGVPSFSVDDREGMTQVLRHLVRLGHRRIGLAVGPPHYVTTARKVGAFRAAHRVVLGHDAPPALLAHAPFGLAGGRAAAGALAAAGASAVVCGSDLTALGAVEALRARGLRVPEDVSVVGSDDSPLMAHTDPALTTVRMPVEELAAAAVGALLGQLEGEAVEPSDTLIAPQLTVRRSTAPPGAGSLSSPRRPWRSAR